MNPALTPQPMTAASWFLLGMIAGVVVTLALLGFVIAKTDKRRAPDPAKKAAPLRVQSAMGTAAAPAGGLQLTRPRVLS